MTTTYTTKEGDVWDAISYQVYGSTSYVGCLMEHNLPLVDTFVFDAGVVIQVPDLPTTSSSQLPIWRVSG